MITITFYRFILTQDVIKLKKDHKFHNVFKVIKDHTICEIQTQCDFQRARKLVSRWLKDHYGFCVIHTDNVDEYDREYDHRVCNHKKFIKDMHKMNLEVTVRGLYHGKISREK